MNTPDGLGARRSSSGISITAAENFRASGGGPLVDGWAGKAVTGSGTNSGATDHAVERNSPASSTQLSEISGRITTFVQIAIHQAIQ